MLDLENAMRLAVLASEDVVVAGFLQEVLGESEEQIFIKLRETCWSDLLAMDTVIRKGQIRAELSRRDGNIEQSCDCAF